MSPRTPGPWTQINSGVWQRNYGPAIAAEAVETTTHFGRSEWAGWASGENASRRFRGRGCFQKAKAFADAQARAAILKAEGGK